MIDGNILIGLGALAGFFLSVGVLRIFWVPVIKGFRDYLTARKHLDDVSAAIIGAGGGWVEDNVEQREYLSGISGDAHDFLGLTRERYQQGLMNLSMFFAVVFLLIFLLLMRMAFFGAVGMSLMGGIVVYALLAFTEGDKLRVRQAEQVRQFPFFLDIFLLMVQSNGNINDAINTYREIFGNNEIASELAILQEDLKSHSLLDSFERLRNRIGNDDLRNILGELTQKLRTGTDLRLTLEQQAEDMRSLREELGAQAAERLNAKFNFPVVFAALATLLIFLSPAIAQMFESGFL